MEPEQLLDVCAQVLGCTTVDLTSPSRRAPLVRNRHLAMFAIRRSTLLSYPQIARLFGGRDHTTVIHAVEKIYDLLEADATVTADAVRLCLAVEAAAPMGRVSAPMQRL